MGALLMEHDGWRVEVDDEVCEDPDCRHRVLTDPDGVRTPFDIRTDGGGVVGVAAHGPGFLVCVMTFDGDYGINVWEHHVTPDGTVLGSEPIAHGFADLFAHDAANPTLAAMQWYAKNGLVVFESE